MRSRRGNRSHKETEKYFGHGVIRASDALGIDFRMDLPITPPDEVSFPWLRLAGGFETGIEQMYEVEALQAFLSIPELQHLVGGADPLSDDLPLREQRILLERMRQSSRISDSLRKHLTDIL